LAKLFKQALYENRPAFVDYFFRINYDPRRTLDQIEDESFSKSRQNESTIPVDSDNTFNTQNLTTRDIITEFQKQTRLSRRGLEFIFELYKNAFNSNIQVSKL
jgi:hypothetical protein